MQLEKGYATIAVTALMSALSVLAIGYSHFSIAEARKINRVTQQLELDTTLESVFHQTVYDLQSRRLSFQENGQHRTTYDGQDFSISFQIENKKSDINRLSKSALEAEVQDVLSLNEARTFLNALGPKPNRNEVRFESVTAFEEHITDAKALACMRDRFTLFRSTAVVQQENSGGEQYVRDGIILRVMIETDSAKVYRGLDTVVLFTGLEDDPFWVLGWQRRGIGELGECNESA